MADECSRSERRLKAQRNAYRSWANTADPSARTAPARKASLDRFERQVDPNGELPDAERARRAKAARSAWYAEMQLRSARSRRKAAAARRRAAELDAEAQAADTELAAEGGDAA